LYCMDNVQKCHWNLKYKYKNSKGGTFGNLIDNILHILLQYSTSQQSTWDKLVQVVSTPWKSTGCNNKKGQATYSLVYTTQKNFKTTKYIVIFIPSIPLVPSTLLIAHVAICPAKLWARF
jgi:hypothetical protein